MSQAAIALIAGLILGGIFSVFVARRSIAEAKIYGGVGAKLFHFLGVLGFCMTLPTVIAALVVRGGSALAFPLGIGCVIAAFLALLIFAAIEQPARPAPSEEGEVWTEAKARSSGL